MDNTDETISVPYIVFESCQTRAERQQKRLVIALIISIALLFLSNAIWLYAWSQYDYESYELETSDGGNANFIGNDGDIINGERESKKTDEERWEIKGENDETEAG